MKENRAIKTEERDKEKEQSCLLDIVGGESWQIIRRNLVALFCRTHFIKSRKFS